MGAAVNIKSRENRQSVISALTSIQSRLSLYKNSLPENGLVLFSGNVECVETGRDKRLLIDVELYSPISHSLYKCDDRFHTDQLRSTLNAGEPRIGFVIVDGKGALFARLQGTQKSILAKCNVDLPRKHNKGGQSSTRFAHIRDEKRHNYLRKVAECALECFINVNDGDGLISVDGLIVAGLAELKTELTKSDLFDKRLQALVLKHVDVAYGGESGLQQAMALCADCLENVKLVHEKKLLGEFFEHIAKESGLVCFGVDETMRALEAGAIKTLLVWEDLPLKRYTLIDQDDRNQQEKIHYWTPENVRFDFYF
jgi:peptide chain release factor subunit 1